MVESQLRRTNQNIHTRTYVWQCRESLVPAAPTGAGGLYISTTVDLLTIPEATLLLKGHERNILFRLTVILV